MPGPLCGHGVGGWRIRAETRTLSPCHASQREVESREPEGPQDSTWNLTSGYPKLPPIRISWKGLVSGSEL
jgi:hypothetical protein